MNATKISTRTNTRYITSWKVLTDCNTKMKFYVFLKNTLRPICVGSVDTISSTIFLDITLCFEDLITLQIEEIKNGTAAQAQTPNPSLLILLFSDST